MKRLLVLSVIAVLFTAACSFGAVQDFEVFTLDIPEGWTASRDGSTVGVAKNDKTSALTMSIVTEENMSVEDVAKAFAKEFGASDPKPTGDGDYTFSFINSGVKSDCLLSGEDGVFILIVMTGDDVATMTAIRDSFTLKLN